MKSGPVAGRGRGRPPGGGNRPADARELLLDAAERSFVKRGYRASTMQAIAAEAGYTRAVIYRHFATRDELLDALVVRVALGKMAQIANRLPGTDPGELVVESLVSVSTEVAQDPLLGVLSERTADGNVAGLIAGSATLGEVLAGHFETAFREVGAGYLRAGLRPADAARFVLAVALGLLLRLIPAAGDAEQVRRYVRVFVLPALAADPPPVTAVFAPLG